MKDGETIYFIEKCEIGAKLQILRDSLLNDYEKCITSKDDSLKSFASMYETLAGGVLTATKELDKATVYKARYKEDESHFYK